MLDATASTTATTAATTTALPTASTADAAAAAETAAATPTAEAPPASDAAAGAAAIGVEPATIIAILTQLVEVLNQLVSLLMQQGTMGGGPGQGPGQKGGFGDPGQKGGFPGQSEVGGASGKPGQFPGQGTPGQTTQVGGASGAPGQAPISAPLMKPLHWFPRAAEKGAKEARAESSTGSIVTVVHGADGSYRLANPTGRGETVAIDGTFAHFDANGRFVQTGSVNGKHLGIADHSNDVQVRYGSQVDTSKPIGQVSTTPVFLKASAVDPSKPIGQTASTVKPVFIKSTGVTTTQQTTTPVFLQSSGVNTSAPLGSSSGSSNVIVSNYSNASTTAVDTAADNSTAAASPGSNVPPGQNDAGDHVAPPAPSGLGAGLPG